MQTECNFVAGKVEVSDRIKERMQDLNFKAVDLAKMKVAGKSAISQWVTE